MAVASNRVRASFFFQAEDGIRDVAVTGVQTCALPIFMEKNATVANVEELGFTKESLEKFRLLLHKPSGLILVTGPASSGKSTTVYAEIGRARVGKECRSRWSPYH